MKLHPKCPDCGLDFPNDQDLKKHYKKTHAKVKCEKCDEEVLESEMGKHMSSHPDQKSFKSSIAMGKIKAKSNYVSDEPKKPKTAWNLFMAEKRQSVKEANPNAIPSEIMKLLGAEWAVANKTIYEKKLHEWDDRPRLKMVVRKEASGNYTTNPIDKDEDVEMKRAEAHKFECVFCEEQLESKELLKTHIRKHIKNADEAAEERETEPDIQMTQELEDIREDESLTNEAVIVQEELEDDIEKETISNEAGIEQKAH